MKNYKPWSEFAEIGKKKPSIMKVDVFDKPDEQFTQKKLKEEVPF